MEIRKTRACEIDRLMDIYAHARRFMAEHGNPLQWGPTCWPPRRLLEEDVEKGRSYVCVHEGRIVGTFCFLSGEAPEPCYENITEGAWRWPGPYGVVHRIASDGTVRGTGRFCLAWALEACGHLRIDTHGDNAVMQRMLEGMGFVRTGTVHVEEDDMPRLAYEIRSGG